MSRVKQSLCLGCYLRDGVTLEKLIPAVAKMGYAAVEFWGREGTPVEQILELTRKHGLAIASMSGHASLPDGMNKPANHDRIERELVESIDLAVEWGVPGLICFSGNREGKSDEEGLANTVACMNRVKGHAEQKRINLNLELLNSKVDHADYQCDRTPWGVQVCEAAASPRVKLLYDIYHMQIMEGDLIRTITQHIRHIGHFHTAGNPGRRDMDETQEIYYPAVMKAIADAGYEYYVGHEFSPKGDVLEALRAAFETCKGD